MAVEVLGQCGILAVFLAFTLKIFLEVNKTQNVPYMDEIFHIPQAQNYCHGNFYHWNSKITTLPGLYISSQLLLQVVSLVRSKQVQDVCSTFDLRLTSVVFIIGCFFIIQRVFKEQASTLDVEMSSTKKSAIKEKKNETISNTRINISALLVTSFPLLYFFTFLYYTDVGSTFFVIFSYYLGNQQRYGISAVVGVFAIMFRQTNIIWIGFTCACAILNHLKQQNVYKSDDALFRQILNSILGCFLHFKVVFVIVFPYILVFLAFVTFVVKNNGIVVGDRSSHEASLNFPQIMYFCAFTVFFSSFVMTRFLNLGYTWGRIKLYMSSPVMVITGILICAGMVVAVRYFTYVHLYLVSDNRHYTFYIWNRVFQAHWTMRYALIPGYFAALLIILNELGRKCDSIWILVFLLCTAVVLVPQKLLEFRYFIVPYLLFRMNMKISSWFELFIEGLVYTAVNGATLYLFLYRTFTQNELTEQRFMW